MNIVLYLRFDSYFRQCCIDIPQNQMQSGISTTKIKPKICYGYENQLTMTYQGDSIRKSTTNQQKKEPMNRRVATETYDKGFNINTEMKKVVKQFRLPFKSTSPKLKKNMITESNSNSNNKLCFVGANQRKKAGMKNGLRVNTDTGPLIKKKKVSHIVEKNNINLRDDRKHLLDDLNYFQNSQIVKKNKFNQKKLKSGKSIQNFNSHKCRTQTEGTLDSTPQNLNFNDIQLIGLIGQGTFGKVFQAKIRKTNEIIAVKRVFQDPKYKNREVQIVKMLQGQNVMKVFGTYKTIQQGSQYLNIIMEHYDGDLYNYIKQYGKRSLSNFDIKVLSYQIFRGLMYTHSLSICHRDIKPHNLLVKNKKIAICDFGSAKIITSEPNLPYICSRCYRAPQLIFGANHYTTMIDIWSTGCVILQMINHVPLFIGESSIDHLIEIIKVMGTPTKTQVIDMNPEYDLNDYKFPKIKKKDWKKIFPKIDEQLLNLISQIMIYSPKERLNAAEALCHEYFDELRDERTYTQIYKQYGLNLFNFDQIELSGKDHLISKLLPPWWRG